MHSHDCYKYENLYLNNKNQPKEKLYKFFKRN